MDTGGRPHHNAPPREPASVVAAPPRSQQAYNHGVVLVRCPGCQGLHLIADRLGYFAEGGTDMEQLAAAAGETVVKGSLPTRLAGGAGAASGVATAAAAASAATAPPARVALHRSAEDGNVWELSQADLAVLASPTKSVKLT